MERAHVADLERRTGVHLRPAPETIQAEHRAIQPVHQFEIGTDDALQQRLARREAQALASAVGADAI